MALTDLQKAQNKAAQIVRDRAHTTRCKLLREACEAADISPEVQQARKAFDVADAASDAARELKNERVRALSEQIDKLKAEIVSLENSDELHQLALERRNASSAWQKVRLDKEKEAAAGFPDLKELSSRYSAVAWKPPQDVLDAMECARKNATVDAIKPKKPRP